MVEAWKARRENPLEIGLGLLDLFGVDRPSRRQAAAALVLGDALTRINSYYPTPKQAKEMSRAMKKKRRH